MPKRKSEETQPVTVTEVSSIPTGVTQTAVPNEGQKTSIPMSMLELKMLESQAQFTHIQSELEKRTKEFNEYSDSAKSELLRLQGEYRAIQSIIK